MRVIVVGYGVMGKKVCKAVNEDESMTLAAVVSPVFDQTPEVPYYTNINDVKEEADAVIDFSHPANLESIMTYVRAHKIPVVLATTGFSEEQLQAIHDLAHEVPVFQSYNTSYGVAMLNKMVKEFTQDFYNHNFDVEITEAHMLYNTAASSIDGAHPVYDRQSKHVAREHNEIGIQSIRAGTIYGEHTVLYGGDDELIEIKHTALSRDIFAKGAVSALKALSQKEVGFYNLETLYN